MGWIYLLLNITTKVKNRYMEHNTAVKLKKLTAKNKMGNGELHHLRN